MSHIRLVTTSPAPQCYISTQHSVLHGFFCKNVPLLCYLVAAVIHIKSLRGQTYSSQYRDTCQEKDIKIIWTTVNAACQGHSSTCHRLTIPGLYKLFIIYLYSSAALIHVWYIRGICACQCSNWHHVRVGGYFMYGRMCVEVSAQKVAILTKVSCGFSSVRHMLRLYLISGHDYICIFSKSLVSICCLMLI